MDLAKFKDVAEGVYAAVSTVALLVAGVWVYWNYVSQRERAERAEFDLTADFLGRQDGKWLIEVSARLANRGKVRHLMQNAMLNIRYLTAEDEVRDSDIKDHFAQTYFPHSIGRRRVWWDSYIDPGLEFRNSYVTTVPERATYILLLCQFEYDKKDRRKVWPAQRALKVPDAGGPPAGARGTTSPAPGDEVSPPRPAAAG